MTRSCHLGFLFFLFFNFSLQSQVIVQSLQDSLIKDQYGDFKANPGDSILYKLFISINGDTAKNVQLDTMNFSPYLHIDPNSLHINPLARPDTFACMGNVGLNVLAANGLLLNDLDPDNKSGTISVILCGYPTPLTAVNTEFTSSGGGKVTVQSNGSFVYTPDVGFTGLDSFYYAISDGDAMSADDKDLVVINVQNPVWFVNNASAAAGSKGTLAEPFKNLAEMNTANAAGGVNDPKDGHVIYLYKGNADYTGGLTLRNGQKLLGQGSSTTSFGTLSGLIIPSSSLSLPSPDGNRPVILNAAGDGITIRQNNQINGLNLGNTTGMAVKNSAMLSAGNVKIRDVSVTGTGGAINLSDGGTMDIVFSNLATTSHAGTFINLIGTGGSFQVENNTGVDVNCTGVAQGINILNSTGTAIFSFGDVNINSSSTGVNLNSNSGSTITFSDLDITTTNASGIVGASTGTVNSSTGTISTGSGKAVDISGSALGMTLTSITSIGGANPGISLSTTTGSFTVIGDNSNTIQGGNGSGGTISGSATDAIVLSNTQNVTLRRMIIGTLASQIVDNALQLTNASETYLEYCTVQYTGNSGINGNGGGNSGFRFNNCISNNTGNAINEHAFAFDGGGMTDYLTGTVQINNSLISNFYDRGIDIRNYNGVLTLGITGTNFSTNSNGQGIRLIADGPPGGMGGATINFTLSGGMFSNLRSEGVFAEAKEPGTTVVSNISNTTFKDGYSIMGTVVAGGLIIASSNGMHDFTIKGCTFDNLALGIGISNNKNGRIQGHIGGPMISERNQFINTNNSDGISVSAEGSGGSGSIQTTLNIENNLIKGPCDEGIQIMNGGLVNTGGQMHLTIQNNLIGNTTNIADKGIQLRSLDNAQTYSKITGNTINVGFESMDLGSAQTSEMHNTILNNIITQPMDDLEVKTMSGTGESSCLNITGNTLSANRIELTSALSPPSVFNVVGGTAAISGNNSMAMVFTSGTFGSIGSCTQPNLPSN